MLWTLDVLIRYLRNCNRIPIFVHYPPPPPSPIVEIGTLLLDVLCYVMALERDSLAMFPSTFSSCLLYLPSPENEGASEEVMTRLCHYVLPMCLGQSTSLSQQLSWCYNDVMSVNDHDVIMMSCQWMIMMSYMLCCQWRSWCHNDVMSSPSPLPPSPPPVHPYMADTLQSHLSMSTSPALMMVLEGCKQTKLHLLMADTLMQLKRDVCTVSQWCHDDVMLVNDHDVIMM